MKTAPENVTPMSHSTPPRSGTPPDEVVSAVRGLLDSDYAVNLRDLGERLRGKRVAEASGGHSGYLLRFEDGAWVAAWLDPRSWRMEFTTGDGDPPEEVTSLLVSSAVPDASAALDADRPYAHEANDIAIETRKALGKPVTGVSIGERAFSLCFPEGMELEGTVFKNVAGNFTLRVFWEQW